MSDTYQCEMCGDAFNKGWSDEEQDAEAAELHGQIDDPATVCADCYNRLAVAYGWPIDETGAIP